MSSDKTRVPPILANKEATAASVFRPENLLREARRQKGLARSEVPAICILDPDGDLVRRLRSEARGRRCEAWACYHTELFAFEWEGLELGVVGCAVGASFAVLVAEQLFVSGCRFLISMTSSGQIVARGEPPYFVVIDRALRDEGTSYHYLPPSEYSLADPALVRMAADSLRSAPVPVYVGATWTTDAPFRETAAAIASARERGILAVEMEAAALYAFSAARSRAVLCLAHVTNLMAQNEGDFEKGEADGTRDAMEVIALTAKRWLESGTALHSDVCVGPEAGREGSARQVGTRRDP